VPAWKSAKVVPVAPRGLGVLDDAGEGGSGGECARSSRCEYSSSCSSRHAVGCKEEPVCLQGRARCVFIVTRSADSRQGRCGMVVVAVNCSTQHCLDVRRHTADTTMVLHSMLVGRGGTCLQASRGGEVGVRETCIAHPDSLFFEASLSAFFYSFQKSFIPVCAVLGSLDRVAHYLQRHPRPTLHALHIPCQPSYSQAGTRCMKKFSAHQVPALIDELVASHAAMV
jgi:hypothetical protein